MDGKTVFTMKEYLSDVNDGIFEKFSKVYEAYDNKKNKIEIFSSGVLGFGIASMLVSLDVSTRMYTFDAKMGSIVIGSLILVVALGINNRYKQSKAPEKEQYFHNVLDVIEESRTLNSMIAIVGDLEIDKIRQLCWILNDLQKRNLEIIHSSSPRYVEYHIDHQYFDNVIFRDRDTNDLFTYSRNSYSPNLYDYQFYTWNEENHLVKAIASYTLEGGIDITA